MKSITVIADDRIGLLSDITYILGKSKINIEGLDVTAIGGKSIIHLIIKDYQKAENALKRNGYKIMDSEVLIIKIDDKPGELSKVTKMVADDKIDIQNVHVIARDNKNAVIGLVVDKTRKAKNILKDYLVDEEL
ncbi:MAG: ACT domain-containing protein [Candidatus Micrarchaeia archaeon]